jgi:hypothetical protein
MAFTSLTKSEIWWKAMLWIFYIDHEKLIADYPDAKMEIDLIRDTLLQIWQLIGSTPKENGNDLRFKQLTDTAETERKVLNRYVNGKALYTGLLSLFSSVCKEMRANNNETSKESEVRPELPYLNRQCLNRGKEPTRSHFSVSFNLRR